MVLTFEDTPLFDWLRKNRFFLLGLAVLVVAIQGYNYYAPGLKYSKQAEAWALYDSVMANIMTDMENNLAAELSRAEAEPMVYPWVVFSATNLALTANMHQMLGTLQPKLASLVNDEHAMGYKAITSSNEVSNIASVLLARVEDLDSRGEMTWTNPEPQGAKVNLVVTDSAGTAYGLSLGLYEGVAPAASAAFLAAVDNGLLIGKDLFTTGGAISLRDFDEEATESLPLEREFGYFHLAGSLSTNAASGEPGQQEPDGFTLYLQDATRADGTTSVFGTVTEGLEALQEAASTPGSELTYAITEATAL